MVQESRPTIVEGTPSEYKELMIQCWNEKSSERPKINTLLDKRLKKMWKNYYNNIELNTLKVNKILDYIIQILQLVKFIILKIYHAKVHYILYNV